MEIETAARKHLLAQPSITTLVSDRVWKFKLEEAIEGTGRTALVVRRGSGWTKPGMNSQEYPMLVVECWADHSRPGNGEMPLKEDRDERAMQLAREVDRVLHQKDREVRMWADALQVLGCFRGSEPTSPMEVEGVVVVRLTYDVQLVH